ncbi:tetratricopeptide repeat protein [Pelagibius sp. Alg239-R121]|uniref:tetratricopeptide repeat protein n=1 Tax=Pelagibius sp. Alg239-R121 TaxID=2993448 RepID=UPI0024A69467|nr:tetratricopeptide repeat protein [Pelagibius sp. Alg239-R121]
MTDIRKVDYPATALAMFAGVGIIIASLYMWKETDAVEKNAPVDPQVTEAIKQARGLQKLGKWQEAATTFERYAHEGYPTAMFHLAKAYSRGWGTERDLEKSRQMLLRAVQYQFPFRGEAAYELGRLYQRSKGKDCSRIAVEWFMRALEWDYRKAHVQLAMHHERGLGVARDVDQAVIHYREAALAGYESASIRFARALQKGRFGMTPDPKRAQFLASKAIEALKDKAANGSGSAAKMLGRLYRDGEFVETNLIVAARWLRHASHLGDAGGMHDLANLMLATDDAAKASQEALGWLHRAADLGHGGAMTALGRLHLKEDHGLRRKDAAAWFKKGVEAGHGGSMEELARLCAKGQLVPKDLEGAIKLARRGTALGHLGSKTLLKDLLAMSGGKEDVG